MSRNIELVTSLAQELQRQVSPGDGVVLNEVRCRDILHKLEDCRIDTYLLTRTLIGRRVAKLKKHEQLGEQARALIQKWKDIVDKEKSLQCTGRAAEALSAFRKRVEALQLEGRRKPDMIACKELRQRYTPEKSHGELVGVPIGLKLQGRGEAAILGIHTRILSGIDARKDEPCYAVCVSGGYADDEDDAHNGIIRYTGSGGQKGKRQVKDQEENVDNASLICSVATKEPIRVLRGSRENGKRVYYYEGLYHCTQWDYVPSADGPMVYIFTLEPIHGKSRHTVVVESSSSNTKICNVRGGSRNRILSHMENTACSQTARGHPDPRHGLPEVV